MLDIIAAPARFRPVTDPTLNPESTRNSKNKPIIQELLVRPPLPPGAEQTLETYRVKARTDYVRLGSSLLLGGLSAPRNQQTGSCNGNYEYADDREERRRVHAENIPCLARRENSHC